jgi:hypothetical protein
MPERKYFDNFRLGYKVSAAVRRSVGERRYLGYSKTKNPGLARSREVSPIGKQDDFDSDQRKLHARAGKPARQ